MRRTGPTAAGLAVILVTSGIHVTLFWPFNSLVVSGAITVLWIVGLTNAFNFLDNMDGLAAGVGMAAALLFAAAQVQVGSLFAPAVLVATGAEGADEEGLRGDRGTRRGAHESPAGPAV